LQPVSDPPVFQSTAATTTDPFEADPNSVCKAVDVVRCAAWQVPAR